MPVNFATIEAVIAKRNAFIDLQQAKLEASLLKIGSRFSNDIQQIIGTGVFDASVLVDALDSIGWTKALIEMIDPLSEGFQELLRYSRDLSIALDVPFILTTQAELELTAFIQAKQNNVIFNFRDAIARTMTDTVVAARLSRRPFEQIVQEIDEELALQGRRAATEVSTALNQYDRAVMAKVYENADIKRFVYYPPSTIATSRESCKRAVNSKLQSTGWTRADIDRDSELDFIKGGKPYYNCRHDWLPALKGVTYA